MARSVTRMGIPSRFQTNANVVASQDFIPGPTIPTAAISSPTATQTSSPTVPQSAFVTQTETQNVKTPHGNIAVRYSILEGTGKPIIRPVNIIKNITFNEPYTSSSNGFTNSGTTTYDYGIQNNNIVQQVTSQKGSVVYDGVQVATINNRSITPTKNIISQQIMSNNQYLGTINYVPQVNNNVISLGYSSFKGTTVQKTVPVYYFDPFSGMDFKVGYTYSSNPTTYNPTTNQVGLTFPSINTMFGTSPLFINAQSATINIGNTPTKIFYNIKTSPSSQQTYFTGFNVGGKSQQNLYISNGGSTQEYQIAQGGIVNSQSFKPITLSNIKTNATLSYQNNQYSITGNDIATESLPGGVQVMGTLGIGSVVNNEITYNFTPLSYYLLGAKTIPTSTPSGLGLATNLLTAQGFSISQIQSIFQSQPTSISESINSKTGAISLNYTPYVSSKSYEIGPNYTTTGYVNYNSAGNAVGGADYLTPKSFSIGTTTSDTNGNIVLSISSLPKGYTQSQYQNQISSIVNNNIKTLPSEIFNTSSLTANNGKFFGFEQLLLPAELAVNYAYGVGKQAYTAGYRTGAGTISLESGLISLGGAIAKGEAPVFIVASPVTALLGAALNIVTSEALSFYTKGTPLSNNSLVTAGALGSISGSILGTIAPEGTSAIAYTASQTGKFVLINSVLGGSINLIYGALTPSVLFHNAPSEISNNQTKQQLFQQHRLSQLQSGTQLTSQNTSTNIPIVSLLSFVGQGALSGANFATEFGGELGLGSLALSKGLSIIPGTAGKILTNPFVAKPLIAIGFGASSYEIGIATGEPQREAVISSFLIGASVLVSPGGGSTGKSTDTTLNAENTAAFFKVNPTGSNVDVVDIRNPTSIDLLNGMHAESTYFLKGLPSSENIISTPEYQVSFNNGKVLYSITPDPEQATEALASASYEIGSKLYGSDRAYFAATATDRMPIVSTITGQESIVQTVSISNLDLSNVKGKIFGIKVSDIVSAKVISYGDITGATTDTQTNFASGEGQQKLIFNVKNNLFGRLIGTPTREIVVSDNFIKTPEAIVTEGGNDNFIGRITNSFESENKGSFYGEKGSPDVTSIKKAFGNFIGKADYTGKVLAPTPEGTTQSLILYYETNNLADIASTVGFDAGTKSFEPTDISSKPLKPFTTETPQNIIETPTSTPSGETQVIASIQKGSISSGVIKGAPPISTSITVPVEQESLINLATVPLSQTTSTKNIPLTSLDPIIQPGQKMSISVLPKLGITSSLSTRQSISKSETQKSIFPTTTTNAFISTSKLATNQLTSQKSKQKTSQKSTQKTQYLDLNRGSFPISPIPNTKLYYGIPFPFKLKNTKAKKINYKQDKSIYFGYTPDLSHALLNIIGTKTNIGLSRPISKRSKK